MHSALVVPAPEVGGVGRLEITPATGERALGRIGNGGREMPGASRDAPDRPEIVDLLARGQAAANARLQSQYHVRASAFRARRFLTMSPLRSWTRLRGDACAHSVRTTPNELVSIW